MIDQQGGSGGWDSDDYRQYMRDIIHNAADPRLGIVWLSHEAERRHEEYVEAHAVRCSDCKVALRVNGEPVTVEDVDPPGKTMRCNDCEHNR